MPVICNDSFAYLIGRKIGKHKMAKIISPKKT
ncbi:phosphatidate cytidylyltransferase [bacterium]|nr:phosphatidate cytidylyltransferase [bacterium]MBO6021723.1 phosphatidate cytidylyltransferase [bacterium]MBO6042657.1 phosphatidate cytidylyltransferase [bacterium]MBO6072920.1 phosphatidate cytidylyltransferase [bacterium]MBO6094489.1 phosphatidate cytidylyltransferase [bacterium]